MFVQDGQGGGGLTDGDEFLSPLSHNHIVSSLVLYLGGEVSPLRDGDDDDLP
jgi:hypothetical protein